MSVLDRQLEADLDWRQLELAELKILVQQSATNATRQSAMLRALWTMLYAHFEGFCKYALQLYVDELTGKNILTIALAEGLAVSSLSPTFKTLLANQALTGRIQFIRDLHAAYLQRARFDPTTLETNNLWPHVLERMLAACSLSSTYVGAEGARLRTLVARRNEIAHGKPNTIRSLTEYQPYENATVLVMFEVALGIANALDDKTYLR